MPSCMLQARADLHLDQDSLPPDLEMDSSIAEPGSARRSISFAARPSSDSRLAISTAIASWSARVPKTTTRRPARSRICPNECRSGCRWSFSSVVSSVLTLGAIVEDLPVVDQHVSQGVQVVRGIGPVAEALGQLLQLVPTDRWRYRSRR